MQENKICCSGATMIYSKGGGVQENVLFIIHCFFVFWVTLKILNKNKYYGMSQGGPDPGSTFLDSPLICCNG